MLECENASYCKETSTLQFTDAIIILCLTANQALCTNYSDNCKALCWLE